MAFAASTSLPETVFMVPEGNYTEALNEIITRHRNYTLAKANGKLGTNETTLANLQQQSSHVGRLQEKRYGVCTLCLEPMKAGDRVVKLPCGHCFHAGTSEGLNASSVKVGRKRALSRTTDTCKGILYWLENNTSCPQCRFNLPTQLPEPSRSEMILVPLLHRQNRVISRQTDIIKDQQKQIEQLKRDLARGKKKKKPNEHNKPPTATTQPATSPPQPRAISRGQTLYTSVQGKPSPLTQQHHNLYLPRLSWQDSSSIDQQECRKKILAKVTAIALKDIIVRGSMDEQAKQTRLQELAAKVELILYCCSTSFAVYSNISTLRARTLNTVRSLAEKARALKLQNGAPGISLQFQQ